MRIGILGRVAVWDDHGDEVALRPQVQRLIGLLLATESVVTIDQISEYVVGGRRAGSAARTAAGRLRAVVGDHLVTVGSGYELVLAPDELDATVVETLRERAASARSNARVDLLSAAFEFWRGPGLGDLAAEEWAAPTAARLDRLRVDTLEDLAEALIDVGRWSDAVMLLEPHLADVPYQERPVALLMRALARSGRITEALRCLRQFRTTLRSDIGVGPSESLTALEFDLLSEADPRPDDINESSVGLAPALSNIREPLSSFVGRGDEVKELVDDLDSKRLITLTGPGGAGKTRLAIRIASKSADLFPDGSWFVDLATVSETSEVEIVTASTLGVHVEPGRSATDSIVEHLQGLRALLIVDNCEHVLEAAARLIATLANSGSSLRLLATSRERLGIDGEHVHVVPSLDDFEGHTLFCARAAQADDRFAPSDDDRLVIETICRRLDGSPLAIELAAARTRSLTPADVLERLDDRFRLLSKRRAAITRHGSLAAMVEWSYDLLGDAEQGVFDRLSVFPGDFDLAAATAVASTAHAAINIEDVLDSLVDKSMVVADRSRHHARFVLLDTLRAYGATRLAARDDTHAARRRHQDHFLHAAQSIRDLNVGGAFNDMAPFAMVRRDWHNFRAATTWALDDGEPSRAVGIASLPPVYYLFLDEHAGWIDAILARLPAEHPLAAICCAFSALWNTLRGNNPEAIRMGHRGLQLEDPIGVAHRMLWWAIAEAHLNTGDPVEGLAASRRAMLAGTGTSTDAELISPLQLACDCAVAVEPDAVQGFADRLAVVAATHPSRINDAAAATSAGYALLARGDAEAAHLRFREIYDDTIGIPHTQGVALRNLAVAASWPGSPADSTLFIDALDHVYRNRMWSLVWVVVEALAIHWGRCGRPLDASVLVGYLERHGFSYGMLIEGRSELDAAIERMNGSGGATAAGAEMSRDELVSFALDGRRAHRPVGPAAM